MAVKLVTLPASDPITLADLKAHLRVDFTDYDDLIAAYQKAAVAYAQNYTGRVFIDQTWDLYLDEFPDDGSPIELPNPPLIEVESVSYSDGAGGWTEWDAANYLVDTASEKARVALPSSGSWPTAPTQINAVRIRFRAGYLKPDSPAEANVPADILAAIKLTVGTLWAHRESVVVGQAASELPWAAKQLLFQHRVHTGMA